MFPKKFTYLNKYHLFDDDVIINFAQFELKKRERVTH